jgi:hypothetical protein
MWTCLSILIVGLIVSTIVLLVKRPISQWNFKGRSRDTVTYKNVVESNNDLVRILAVSDTHDRNEE